jgi:hypothetical protein
VAQYERGTLPLPPNTIRQMFGCGVRAGMYPMTPQQAYWYICVNAAEVRAQRLWGACTRANGMEANVPVATGVPRNARCAVRVLRVWRRLTLPLPRVLRLLCAARKGVPRPRDAAACAAEALAAVRGWSWGIEQAVRNTDPAGISRAGIRDRCGQGGAKGGGDASGQVGG